MSPQRRYPDRVPRRSVERPRSARDARAAQARRYTTNRPLQSTKSMTAKLAILGVVATLGIGGLIAAQMAAGRDPSLGPKAANRVKKTSTSSSNSRSTSGGSASGSSATDPYAQTYGDDGYSGSSGYSSGSSGSSDSGYSTQQSTPAPVTSSTS
jgi:hypothetical protein